MTLALIQAGALVAIALSLVAIACLLLSGALRGPAGPPGERGPAGPQGPRPLG